MSIDRLSKSWPIGAPPTSQRLFAFDDNFEIKTFVQSSTFWISKLQINLTKLNLKNQLQFANVQFGFPSAHTILNSFGSHLLFHFSIFHFYKTWNNDYYSKSILNFIVMKHIYLLIKQSNNQLVFNRGYCVENLKFTRSTTTTLELATAIIFFP